jgi:hypothetical protein
MRDIRAHEHGAADLDPGVKDLALPISRQIRMRLVVMPYHSRYLSAQMLFVKVKSLLTVPAIVQIDI